MTSPPVVASRRASPPAAEREERPVGLVGEEREERLARLLDDLGSGVHRGKGPSPTAPPCPTGLVEVDRILGGGLPRGRLCEIAGPATSGRTSLALSLLGRVTREGHCVAWIDLADALDPASAEAAGVTLERVLWARPPDADAALRCAERVLATGGFALVGLDLGFVGLGSRGAGSRNAGGAVSSVAWSRLRKLAAGSDVVLLSLAARRLAGSQADLALEMVARARFASPPGPGAPSDWLEGLEARAELVRNRTGPGLRVAALRLRAA